MPDPEGGPLIPEGVRNALITGVTLGVVAALVVWFLERFEVARLHSEIREYLDAHEKFRDWQRGREAGPGA